MQCIHVRSVLFLAFAAFFLLSGCNRKEDAANRQKLVGSWIVEGSYPHGGHFKRAITVAPDGHYTCQIASVNPHDSITRTSNIAGTFEINDGVLIDTVTKHSNSNAVLPIVSRGRIVREA